MLKDQDLEVIEYDIKGNPTKLVVTELGKGAFFNDSIVTGDSHHIKSADE